MPAAPHSDILNRPLPAGQPVLAVVGKYNEFRPGVVVKHTPKMVTVRFAGFGTHTVMGLANLAHSHEVSLSASQLMAVTPDDSMPAFFLKHWTALAGDTHG